METESDRVSEAEQAKDDSSPWPLFLTAILEADWGVKWRVVWRVGPGQGVGVLFKQKFIHLR